jgi:hypothetical protein
VVTVEQRFGRKDCYGYAPSAMILVAAGVTVLEIVA